MGKRLWLPVGSKPYPFATDNEHELLINRLWNLKYLVPTARKMEIQQLRDYVAYAEIKTKQLDDAKVEAGATKVAAMSPTQIAEAIKAYIAWKRRKLGLGPRKPLGG